MDEEQKMKTKEALEELNIILDEKPVNFDWELYIETIKTLQDIELQINQQWEQFEKQRKTMTPEQRGDILVNLFLNRHEILTVFCKAQQLLIENKFLQIQEKHKISKKLGYL